MPQRERESRTYGSSSSHGTQQTAVDLNHFFDRLTRNPISGRSSRIGGNNNTTLETKGKRRSAMCELDRAVGVGMIVCGGSKECRRLEIAGRKLISIITHHHQPSSQPGRLTRATGGKANLSDRGGNVSV